MDRQTDTPYSSHRIHLAVSLDREPTEELIAAAAKVVGLTPYDVRLRVRVGLPRTLTCCDSIEDGELKAAALNEFGFMTVVYSQQDLPPAESVKILQIESAEGMLRVRTRQGGLQIPHDEIALIVYGNRRLSRETKELIPMVYTPSSVVPVGLGMALSNSLHKSKTETSGQYFLMLFGHDPHKPALEINQDRFDYSCLGEKRGRTKQENMRTLAEMFQEMKLPMNTWLLQGQSNNRGEAFYNRRMGPDSSLANATLIFWQMLAWEKERHHFTFQRDSA